MVANVIVWDIETVPDTKSFAAANGHDGKSDDEIRAAMDDKFPKHIYHSIICIGALIAYEEDGRWAFRGRLSNDKFQASETCLVDFTKARGDPNY